ncbi:MAG TPA: ABC transporter ATP-binding protein [Bryobacteraceae bacterium]|nr:ABC transporter ATP-binding protein [Bryobacteraceae bacterium]
MSPADSLVESQVRTDSREPLLSVRISAGYGGAAPVLEDVGFTLAPGEILGLVGRSGEGKSTVATAVLKLLSHKGGAATGEILFRGRNLLSLSEKEMRRIRGRDIALVPQSPIASLNPCLSVGAHFREAWDAHSEAPFREFEPRVMDLLASASLPTTGDFLRRYPAQLSVGLAQRVLIAMALVHHPALILADEPTSALDMITQSEILDLLARLNRETGTAILYISHDLLSVAALCHRVAILHERRIVECGPVARIFTAPRHPYTKQLIAAVPRNPFSAL